ncbi:MAG: hypothetical protein ACPHID_05405 [Thermoplasmatota archaeon]
MRRVVALLLLLPLAHAGDGEFGTFVETDEGALWFNMPLDAETPRIVYFDDGDGTLEITEPVYLHFGGGTINVGDLILTDPGKRVAAGQNNEGEAFATDTGVTALDALLRYADKFPVAADGGPDGAYSHGDPFYLDVDGSDDVSAGDIRITDQAEGDAGSRVKATDDDAGDAIPDAPFVIADVVAAIDLDADGALDANEPVYLDADEDELGSIGDVRLTAFGGERAGFQLQWADHEVLHTLFDLAGYDFYFDDSVTNDDTYNAGEAIILDLTGNGVDTGDIVLHDGDLSCGARTAIPADGCDEVEYRALTAEFAFVDDRGDGFDQADTIYVRIDGGNVAAGDLRLTAYSNKKAGTIVSGSDGDVGLAPTTATWDLTAFDADGSGDASRGDLIYLDIQDDGVAGPGDLRILKAGSEAALRFVNHGDDDAERVLTAAPGGDGDVYSIDVGPAGYDIDDPVFLNVAGGATADRNDLLLAPGVQTDAGRLLASDDPEEGEAAGVGLSFAWYNEDGSGGLTMSDRIYLIAGGAATAVKDVRLTEVGSFAPGSRVTASSGESGLSVTALAGTPMWEDEDGDGELDGGDHWFLNIDGAMPGAPVVSFLDFRISGNGGADAPTTATTTRTTSSTSTQTVTTTATTSGTGTQTATSTVTVTGTATQTTSASGSQTGSETQAEAPQEPVPAPAVALLIVALLFAIRRRL